MENKTKNILSGSLIASALFGAAGLTSLSANTSTDFNNLGSGSEVRNVLLNNSAKSYGESTYEMACGKDHKCGKKDSTATKSGDHKCGEAKCGEKKKEAAKKSDKKEGKAKDQKCGEGKCGNK
ncbi:MAG: hypothetical protein NT150_10015 [Bacteroidetes bacterium]|nr:hypothetical protein [Bacteroidota bacterium]